MRGIPACGENRSLEGLSWSGEKAESHAETDILIPGRAAASMVLMCML